MSMHDIINFIPLSRSYIYGAIVHNLLLFAIIAAAVITILCDCLKYKNISYQYTIVIMCAIAIGASFLIVIYNGGDWMANHRLISQYFPLYIVLAGWLLKRWEKYLYHLGSEDLYLWVYLVFGISSICCFRAKSDGHLFSDILKRQSYGKRSRRLLDSQLHRRHQFGGAGEAILPIDRH